MIEILKTFDDGIRQINAIEPGCWVVVTSPSATELLEISETCHVDIDHLRAPLDEEERSRIEVEDEYTLILVDIPTMEERNDKDRYVTIPLGIIISKDVIITICLEETKVLKSFMDGRVRDFFTFNCHYIFLITLYIFIPK